MGGFIDPGALVFDNPAPGTIVCSLQAFLSANITQVSIPASFSDDVKPDGSSGNFISHSIGVQSTIFRGVAKWPLTSVPKTGLSNVSLRLRCSYRTGNSADLYTFGYYGSNGRQDPQADTGVIRFNRANPVEAFVSDDIQLRTTGDKVWNLGGLGVSIVQAAIDANAPFIALAFVQQDETGASHYAVFDGYTMANPPTLVLSFSAGFTKTCSLQAFLAPAGLAQKTVTCGLQGFISNSVPVPTVPSPWTIESPEDGIIGFIFP